MAFCDRCLCWICFNRAHHVRTHNRAGRALFAVASFDNGHRFVLEFSGQSVLDVFRADSIAALGHLDTFESHARLIMSEIFSQATRGETGIG